MICCTRHILGACLVVALGAARFAPAQPTTVSSQPVSTSADSASAPARNFENQLTLIKGNNTPEARKLGAAWLLETGTDEAVSALEGILTATPPDLSAQLAVCAAIADCDRPPPRLLEPMLAILGNRQATLVTAATQCIRRFDSAVVVGRLRPIATDSSHPRTKRIAAIRALGAMSEDIQAVGVLVRLLNDTDRAIQIEALAAFSEATGRAGTAEAAEEWWVRTSSKPPLEWLRALNASRSEQVRRIQDERSELVRRLVSLSRDVYLATPEAERGLYLKGLLADRLASVRNLGLELVNDLITDRKEISAEIKAMIVDLIVDVDPRVRLRAANLLGDLRLTAANSRLASAIPVEIDVDVRTAQVHALGRLEDISSVPLLVECLDDESSSVVAAAAEALGALGRNGRASKKTADLAAQALLDCFEKSTGNQEVLREQLLAAMAATGHSQFRSIFEKELAPDRSVRVRRAAIAGLAAFKDPSPAELLRPLLAAPESELRQAAVDAMGNCGSSTKDLAALTDRLSGDREADAVIREHAWASFMTVAARLAPEDRLIIANRFDKPDDKAQQRRRLDLLRALRADASAYDQLSKQARVDVLENMADAQMELMEYAAAAASLEQAESLLADSTNPRYATLAARSISALLEGNEDDGAARRLDELTDGKAPNGELTDASVLVDVLRQAARKRVSLGADAPSFVATLNLLDIAQRMAERISPAFENELNAMRGEVLSKRDGVVSQLLSEMDKNADAETQLFQFGRQVVLPQIHQRLIQPAQTANGQAAAEARMIELAKRLAPAWNGYEPGCTPQQRKAALEALQALVRSQENNQARASSRASAAISTITA